MPASSTEPHPRPVRRYGRVEVPTMQPVSSTTASPGRLEQLPEFFSVETYRRLAARNTEYRTLTSDERFVLDLLVVRADAFDGVRFTAQARTSPAEIR